MIFYSDWAEKKAVLHLWLVACKALKIPIASKKKIPDNNRTNISRERM